MLFSRLLLAALPLAAALTTPASAETVKMKIAPGLWEYSTKVTVDGQSMDEMMRKQMESAMANMPPEKREQMQKQIGQMGLGSKTQVCVTQAEIDKGFDLNELQSSSSKQRPKDCKHKVLSSSDSGGKFEVQCSMPNGEMHGTGEYKLKGDKEWSFTMLNQMKRSAADKEKKVDVQVDMQAAWKSADCGKVAPRAAKAGTK